LCPNLSATCFGIEGSVWNFSQASLIPNATALIAASFSPMILLREASMKHGHGVVMSPTLFTSYFNEVSCVTSFLPSLLPSLPLPSLSLAVHHSHPNSSLTYPTIMVWLGHESLPHKSVRRPVVYTSSQFCINL
jgi:hypothetical protein